MKLTFKSDIANIIAIFLVWRLALFTVLAYALKHLPLGFTDRFLGGGALNYQQNPWLYSWANFDGEHYLAIAINGYKGLEQAFFPVYPLLMSFLAGPFYENTDLALFPSAVAGLVISNTAFLFALIFLFKLLTLDYSKKFAYLVLFLLLSYPFSFYFAALYNESLFLLLAVLSFYFARKNNWVLASIFGIVSSATRIFGVLLAPSFLLDLWRGGKLKKYGLYAAIIPLGLLLYMFYQWQTVGDPLAFYRLQKLVGEQHQSGLTLLPQVYYRYVNMFLTVDTSNPIYQTIVLEAVVGIAFFLLPIYGFFKRMPLSYVFFALAGFLSPTIQGSFSSVPRYVIVFFPSFIALAFLLSKLPPLPRYAYIAVSTLVMFFEAALFLRGYWVA